MTNIEFAAALRLIADHYENNPDMPQFYGPAVYTYAKADFITGMKALSHGGVVEKRTDEGNGGLFYHRAVRNFGGLEFELTIPKSIVCRKVQEEKWECPDSLLEPEAANVA